MCDLAPLDPTGNQNSTLTQSNHLCINQKRVSLLMFTFSLLEG